MTNLQPPTCLPLDLSRDRECCLKHCFSPLNFEDLQSINIYLRATKPDLGSRDLTLQWSEIIINTNAQMFIYVLMLMMGKWSQYNTWWPHLVTSSSSSRVTPGLGLAWSLSSLSMLMGMEMLGLLTSTLLPLSEEETRSGTMWWVKTSLCFEMINKYVTC